MAYIVDDGEFWAQFDHHQVVDRVDVSSTIGPDVDNVEEIPSVDQNVFDLRFGLLW